VNWEIAKVEGVSIYLDPYNFSPHILVSDVVGLPAEKIKAIVECGARLQNEANVLSMYVMSGRRFSTNYLLPEHKSYVMNGVLFSDAEKAEFMDFLERGDSLYYKEKAKKKQKKRSGYVYLIHLMNTEFYKIGKTNNVSRRIESEISPKLPEEVGIICSIASTDCLSLEKELHAKFADKRKNGEWFTLAQDDIDYIKGLANG